MNLIKILFLVTQVHSFGFFGHSAVMHETKLILNKHCPNFPFEIPSWNLLKDIDADICETCTSHGFDVANDRDSITDLAETAYDILVDNWTSGNLIDAEYNARYVVHYMADSMTIG